MMIILTQKQEMFTQGIFKGMYQRDAYIEAYRPSYALSTIDANASRLAHNEKVMARLRELNQAAETDTIASVTERKQVLTEIARGKVVDFTEGNRIKVSEESLNTSAIQELNTSEVQIGKGDSALMVEITKLKLHSPIHAIDLLNKMERIYEAEGTVTIDNRTLNIYVNSDKAKGLTERLIEGERTDA